MRYVAGGLWLLLSVLLRNTPARWFFAYAGSILALVHLCAMGIGWSDMRKPGPAEQGPPVGGFFIGIAVGLVLGIVAGRYAHRYAPLYWVAQIVTGGFLMFWPLFPI